MNDPKGNLFLYQTEDGQTKIEVTLANDTVWLNADQMAESFQRNKSTISRHIKNVFESGELKPDMRVYQNDLEHGDTETQRFYFIDLQIYFLSVFVSLCFIFQLWYILTQYGAIKRRIKPHHGFLQMML